jgi:tRNA (Thr-GGU) A37 N-methylase
VVVVVVVVVDVVEVEIDVVSVRVVVTNGSPVDDIKTLTAFESIRVATVALINARDELLFVEN